MRLDRLRNRPPETPEARTARLARAQEKRAQRLMRMMISSRYERISMVQYGRAFGQLPEGEAVKSQIHADAHCRDRTFHPDWAPKRHVR